MPLIPDFNVDVYLPATRTDLAILRLKGNLDSFSLSTLEKKMKELLDAKRCHIVVNCQDLKFISSPGMGLFLGTLGEVEKIGGSFSFAQVVHPDVYDAMDLLGFFDVFPVYKEEWEAIQEVNQKK